MSLLNLRRKARLPVPAPRRLILASPDAETICDMAYIRIGKQCEERHKTTPKDLAIPHFLSHYYYSLQLLFSHIPLNYSCSWFPNKYYDYAISFIEIHLDRWNGMHRRRIKRPHARCLCQQGVHSSHQRCNVATSPQVHPLLCRWHRQWHLFRRLQR